MLSLKRIMARDRRLAAIHEAGHVTSARHLGVLVTSAWLEKNSDSDPLSEKQWTGHSAVSFGPSRRTNTMVAVAGAAAEQCWQRQPFEGDAWYDPDFMSASDWAITGCTPGEPSLELFEVVEDMFSLFEPRTGRLWPELIKEARSLMVRAR